MVKTKGECMHAYEPIKLQLETEDVGSMQYVLYIQRSEYLVTFGFNSYTCLARPVASSGDPVIHVSFGLSVTFATLPICDRPSLPFNQQYICAPLSYLVYLFSWCINSMNLYFNQSMDVRTISEAKKKCCTSMTYGWDQLCFFSQRSPRKQCARD